MKISSPKKIISDDFPKESQALAGQLGGIINTFLEEVFSAMSKKINITDNINALMKTIKVTVKNSDGELAKKISIENTLSARISGISVINTYGSAYPISHPYISFIEDSGVVSILNIKGLPINQEFQLVIILWTN